MREEAGLPPCDCPCHDEPEHPPARPAGGAPDDEITEQVARVVRDYGWSQNHDELPTTPGEAARAVLALPAVRAALDAQQAVQRVEALLDGTEEWHARWQNPLFDGYVPPATVTTEKVRRALDGTTP